MTTSGAYSASANEPAAEIPTRQTPVFSDEEIAAEVAKWLHLVWCHEPRHSYGKEDLAVANIAVRRIRRLRGDAT